ncbi:polysaccharide deacetylase family protein [Sphingomonas sp.]|jgi:peptidoglycan/xylan/chitin deacetylase (PgdA/CDA1 family)|uniref:polysaccharide deacetylase family protein n=1 Tax=Sphingomonas sp. TaxID=28214 RepID=UPI0035C86D8A
MSYTRKQLIEERRETAMPAGFTWPGGKRLGVLLGVCLEGWADGAWPGLGPMGNPLPAGAVDTNALHWAEYGGRRGMARILDVLQRRGAKATIFINGVMAQRFPALLKRAADAGHDIAAHSMAQNIVPASLDEAAERRNIADTVAAIAAATGVTARGWASPRFTPSLATERLLAEASFDWHSDLLDDDLPYHVALGERGLIEIPTSVEVNDLPMHVRSGHAPHQMLRVFEDTIAAMRRREGETLKLDAIVHAHVFGRPAGVWVYDEIIRISQESDDVWLGTWSEVAAHARTAIGAA